MNKREPEIHGKKIPKKNPYHLAKKLTDSGFPTHDPNYHSAHRKADELEKAEFGKKPYNEMKKIDRKLPANELAGKNLKSGKLEVSKKIPAKYREEVAFHEKVENTILRNKLRKKRPPK